MERRILVTFLNLLTFSAKSYLRCSAVFVAENDHLYAENESNDSKNSAHNLSRVVDRVCREHQVRMSLQGGVRCGAR